MSGLRERLAAMAGEGYNLVRFYGEGNAYCQSLAALLVEAENAGQPAGKSEGLDDAGPVPCCSSPRRQSSVTPDDVETLAGLLLKHRYVLGQQIGLLCACGEPDPYGQRQGNGAAAHRRHVAKVLVDRLAAAWDEGYYRGVRDEAKDIERADNPYAEPDNT